MKIRNLLTTMLFASATAVVCGALVVGLTTAGCGGNSASKPSSSPAASSAASASATSPDGHTASDSLDWQGYYTGEVPAADCPGINTWLRLGEVNGKVHYKLTETYLTDKPQTYVTLGTATWDADGTTLTLVEAKSDGKNTHPRKVAVAEGFVQLLGIGKVTIDQASRYALKKQDVYAGGGRQLLVNPSSVKVVGKSVSFDGMINYEHRAEGGYKAFTAHFVVNGVAQRYEMQRVVYYRDDFGVGKVVREAKRVANVPLRFSSDDVVAQAVSAYRSGN